MALLEAFNSVGKMEADIQLEIVHNNLNVQN